MQLLDEKLFANACNLIPELGPVRLTQMLQYFGSWQKAWAAPASEYIDCGLPAKIISQIIARKNQINPEQAFAALAQRQIEIVLNVEPQYPQLLKEIATAPPMLYIRGNISALNTNTMAVVGTRKVTLYGQQVCEELVSGLVANNFSIVSGLAFGVDAYALQACISNDGIGIGVLASDLDNASISPRNNFQLAQKILQRGCLVSEYPLGSMVQKQNFPIRNRIISGLSFGTIVVEADIESGALITANYALEQNREVFAVPGSIFSPTSRGTNELIRKGAHMVSNIGHVLDELNIDTQIISETVNAPVSEEERLILDILTREPTHIEDLIRQIKLPAAVVSANLTLLEMKSRIKNLGTGRYVKIR